MLTELKSFERYPYKYVVYIDGLTLIETDNKELAYKVADNYDDETVYLIEYSTELKGK